MPSISPNRVTWGLALACFVAFSAKFFVERSPATYYLYAIFPCFFWGRVLQNPARLLNLVKRTRWLSVLGIATALEAMVIGYFHRSAWTAGFVFLALLWPFLGMERDFRERHKQLGGAWTVVCLAMSVFTLLPVEKGESLLVMYVPLFSSSFFPQAVSGNEGSTFVVSLAAAVSSLLGYWPWLSPFLCRPTTHQSLTSEARYDVPKPS
jgi:Phosphatidylinositolglycan class N (PIG-N)